MRTIRTLATLVPLAALAACASGSGQGGPNGRGGRPGGPGRMGNDSIPMAAPNTTARAELRDANGNSVGSVAFTQTRGGVLVTADLTNLPAGRHAIHVHDTGRCEAPFTTAGGHYNPTMRSHGYRSQMPHHAGDLPNFLIAANGTGRVEALGRDLSLVPGPVGLFDADGASVVVHADADDYASEPAGNSGNRIACGVIAR